MVEYYKEEIRTSKRPHHTLSKMFREVTGTSIAPSLMAKLMKTYDTPIIFTAIAKMEGRTVNNPVTYLFGICKNIAPKDEPRRDYKDVIDMFRQETEKPQLLNPFTT